MKGSWIMAKKRAATVTISGNRFSFRPSADRTGITRAGMASVAIVMSNSF